MKRFLIPAAAAAVVLMVSACQKNDQGRPSSTVQPNRTVQGGSASTNSPGTVSTNTHRSSATRSATTMPR